MEFRENRLTFAQARDIDLVQFLAANGFQPSKIRGHDIWYLSPFRAEIIASFKVNSRINRWYDFGLGQGGSVIDFVMVHQGCNLQKAMQLLGEKSLLAPMARHKVVGSQAEAPKLEITGIGSIISPALQHYLSLRRIPLNIATTYCHQVSYTLGEKFYYGIGFRNNSGGFEIRNPYFKGSSSPKDFTLLENGSCCLDVYEGFFDFLSARVLLPDQAGNDQLILNSLAFVDKATPAMQTYTKVQLYLDINDPGINATNHLCSLGMSYTDCSRLYNGYEDLNSFLCQDALPPSSQSRKVDIPP